tara:strand:+ start:76 stop:468 length:393 start_codon:yes stop_codon:yes gene_type:complete
MSATTHIELVTDHGNAIVERVEMSSGTTARYTAWLPAESPLSGRASTITHIDGFWYGRIGTDPDSASYENLPVGEERSAAVQAAYEARHALAYDLIHRAQPHTKVKSFVAGVGFRADHRHEHGEVTVELN